MTKREIHQRVARMIDHLDRLLINRDISEPDYDAALRELALWEETAMEEIAMTKMLNDEDV